MLRRCAGAAMQFDDHRQRSVAWLVVVRQFEDALDLIAARALPLDNLELRQLPGIDLRVRARDAFVLTGRRHEEDVAHVLERAEDDRELVAQRCEVERSRGDVTRCQRSTLALPTVAGRPVSRRHARVTATLRGSRVRASHRAIVDDRPPTSTPSGLVSSVTAALPPLHSATYRRVG